ncbi:TetR/AcrR family transcriptional regulator [Actinomycetospora atypica]|uniref:TetR/AcrR family transcriptional regulator n=1 Tax=Actinomycetospora atypica TaxID=1290095 RepID=A0ABV9YII8_9PSEU
MTPSTGTSRRPDAARNRAALLEAARAELAENDGPLRLREVARRAGVGQGTLYRHFPTRADLLGALVLDRLEQLVLRLEEAAEVGDGPDLARSLHEFVVAGLETGRDPVFIDVLAGDAEQGTPVGALLDRFDEALATLVEDAQDAGLVSDSLEPTDVLRLLCGVQRAVALAPDLEDLPERYAPALLAALREA